MNITIIGDGVFGTFLKELLGPLVTITDGAENVILAVPIEAYDEVAVQHAGKHLINVCSVQRDSNATCLKYSDEVTGIHPLFGPQSPLENRTAIVTHTCAHTEPLTELFIKANTEICTALPDGRIIDGALHDQMMAVTHLAGLQLLDQLKEVAEDAAWVPEKFIPTSFKRILNFVKQCRDFSPGTLSSIQSNPFKKQD